MYRTTRYLFLVLAIACLSGCNSEPPLYPVTGKVTLGGKAYQRLLVYFRPLNAKATRHTLGVGETDANGNLVLRASAGNGVAAGDYAVSFSCISMPPGSEKVDPTKEKADDNQFLQTVELVPERYLDEQTSNVTFTVKDSYDNVFNFDIPMK